MAAKVAPESEYSLSSATQSDFDCKKDFHYMSMDEIRKLFKVNDFHKGLSNQKAKELLHKHGKNQLKTSYASLYVTILRNLFNGFSCLLWLVFFISITCFVLKRSRNDDENSTFYIVVSIIILLILLLQMLMFGLSSFYSIKCASSIEALTLNNVHVIRDGHRQTIPSTDLVVGDIVLLSTNEKVAADLRLVEAKCLRIDRSAITGESEPVDANVGLLHSDSKIKYTDATNMAFMNSVIVFGSGKGIVVATGNDTIVSKIAYSIEMRSSSVSSSFFQKEMSRFALIIVCIALFFISIYIIVWAACMRTHLTNSQAYDIVLDVFSILISSIPYSMPIAFIANLLIVINSLNKKQILIKHVSNFEALSSLKVLAFDKTGTLTQNKLHVTDVVFGQCDVKLSAERCVYNQSLVSVDKGIIQVLSTCYLCNNYKNPSSDNSIDLALGKFAEKYFSYEKIKNNYRHLQEIEFSSLDKYHVKICEPVDLGVHEFLYSNDEHGKTNIMLIKGAPDLLKLKLKWAIDSDGFRVPIDEDLKEKIGDIHYEWSLKGRRIVMLCKKSLSDDQVVKITNLDKYFKLECNDLVFVGMVAMMDPPRVDCSNSMKQFKLAGIKTVMVTGDFAVNAASLAYQIEILQDAAHHDTLFKLREYRARLAANAAQVLNVHSTKSIVLSGNDLDLMNAGEWRLLCTHYDEIVLARATPQHKVRFIREMQNNGLQVGMIGDGVNDSAALKVADVGVAMGSGSKVAIQSASLILMDDSFAHLLDCILKSRLYFENLRKTFIYLLPACVFSELVFTIFNTLLGTPSFLSSYSMLFICIIIDFMPSIALSFEKPEENLLIKGPRNAKEHLASFVTLFQDYFVKGVYICFFSMLNFFLYFHFYSQLETKDLFFMYQDDSPRNGSKISSRDEFNRILYGAQTTCLLSIVILQSCGNLYATRTRYLSLFRTFPLFSKHRNLALFVASLLSVCTILCLIHIPVFQQVFMTRPVPFPFYPIAIGYAIGLIVLDELKKLLVRKNILKKFLASKF